MGLAAEPEPPDHDAHLGRAVPRPRKRRELPDFAAAHQHLIAALLADDVQLFTGALKDLRRYAEQHSLTAALTSDAALRRLHETWLASPDVSRASVATHTPSVADAMHAGTLIEHLLRVLSADIPDADIFHASSNGLASLIAMVGKWTYGAPFILTEHGIYLRERYMALGYDDATYPVRMLVLRFVRLLTLAAYLEADLITPGSHYNRRWQEYNGADPEKVRPIHNGVDHREFPEAGPEPTAPTLVWVGRIDPLKDLETLIRAAAIVRRGVTGFRLRLFGGVPVGNEEYAERCQARRSPWPRRQRALRGPYPGDPRCLRRRQHRRALEHVRRIPLHGDRGDDVRAGHGLDRTWAASPRPSVMPA